VAFSTAAVQACLDQGLGYSLYTGKCVPKPENPVILGSERLGSVSPLAPNGGTRLSFGYPLSFSGSGMGSEPATGDQQVPGILDRDIYGTGISVGDVIDFGKSLFGNGNGNGGSGLVADPNKCPGATSVRIGDKCVNLTDLGPGGDPAITGAMNGNGSRANGFGAAVKGRFGVGILPRVDVQTVKRCPRGMALGLDGVCYDGLGRNSPKRAWPMGVKPLLTGGDRNAIAKAASAGRKLERSKRQLKKAAKALEKAC